MATKNFMLKKGPAKSTGGKPFSSTNQPANSRREGGKPGKTLMSRVREILCERSRIEGGRYNTRFDDVADAMVRAMEAGSYVHTKEYIDREEGKVANRLADADGKNIKAYIGMPLEGPEAP